ncbi:UvrD-helicase domain-containing protein [Longispora sp. K20-0274]|uniref:HelD family protein n=1 Tax=Longispora sp. K20-0274 TaxID=3088255 RepID=UPI00399B6807
MQSDRAAELAAEQQVVDTVYARLAQVRADAAEVDQEGRDRARSGPVGGLVERDAMVHLADRRIRGLDAAYEGLVFGRLDLEDGSGFHLGRLGLRDEDLEPLLVDWRAPAASVFYQATSGVPLGVVRRRVITCSGPRVLDVDDELLAAHAPAELRLVGEGALMAALDRSRGPAMRDIVATIQGEQDAAIRAPSGGVTEITGGPGTGKTQVALHRAAYLLYAERRRFAERGVLVVGPSAVFTRYISQVLPGLGEEDVRLAALGELAEPVAATRYDEWPVAALKGDARIAGPLADLVWQAPPGTPTGLRISHQGRVLIVDEEDLAAVRRAVRARGVAPNAARGLAAVELLRALWTHRRADDPDPRAAPGATDRADESEQATPGATERPADHRGTGRRADYRDFLDDMADRTDLRDFVEEWWPPLSPTRVLSWLADPARGEAAGLTPAEAALLAASYTDCVATDDDATTGEPAQAPWSVSDVPLLDDLRVLLGASPERKNARTEPLWALQELKTWAERSQEGGYVLSRGLDNGWGLYAAGDPMPIARHPDLDDAPVVAQRWATAVLASLDEKVLDWVDAVDPYGEPGFAPVLRDAAPAREQDDPTGDEGYAHVIVDEAQDLSPMQWRMLGRRGEYASWTVVGDPAQSSWADPPAAREAMERALGPGTRHRFALGTNYRNSREIFGLATRVLAGLVPERELPVAVRGTGLEPELRTVGADDLTAEAGRAAAELLAQVNGTVAVIAAAHRLDALAGLADGRLTVHGALEAKGLEFDATVVVEPAELLAESGSGPRTLYVALTRATNRLTVLQTGPGWLPAAG